MRTHRRPQVSSEGYDDDRFASQAACDAQYRSQPIDLPARKSRGSPRRGLQPPAAARRQPIACGSPPKTTRIKMSAQPCRPEDAASDEHLADLPISRTPCEKSGSRDDVTGRPGPTT